MSLLPGWTAESLDEVLCAGGDYTSLEIRGVEAFNGANSVAGHPSYIFPSCFKKRDASSTLTHLSASGIVFGGELSGDLHDPLARLPSGLESLDLENVAFVDHAKRTHSADATYEPDWTAFSASHDRLTRLRIVSSGLAGSLPSTVPDSVELFDLSNNSLTGTIPDTFLLLSDVPSLSINIGWNALTGTIFSTLFRTNAAALTTINFAADHNQFSGKLPDLLLALRDPGAIRSFTLSLSYNAFTGSVPTTYAPYCNFQSLEILNLVLSHNSFSGSLDFSALQAPAYLALGHYNVQLDNNKITGTLPSSLFAGYNTDWLYTIRLSLASNQLTGTLPAGLLSNLSTTFNGAEIDLSSNSLVGTLPSAFFATYFQVTLAVNRYLTLSVENCKMGGQIPSLTSVLSKATWFNLNLNQNKFEGSLDFAGLFQFASLATNFNVTLSFKNNNLDGEVKIPAISAAGRANLQLSGNRFTKLVCDSGITYVYTFDISNNRGMTGDFPYGLLSSSSSARGMTLSSSNSPITLLNASYTELSGTFPGAAYQPSSLKTLDLSATDIDFCTNTAAWSGLTSCLLEGTNAIGCTMLYSGCNTNPLDLDPFTSYPPYSPYTYSDTTTPNSEPISDEPNHASSLTMSGVIMVALFIISAFFF